VEKVEKVEKLESGEFFVKSGEIYIYDIVSYTDSPSHTSTPRAAWCCSAIMMFRLWSLPE
jgi:hypothetical protein